MGLWNIFHSIDSLLFFDPLQEEKNTPSNFATISKTQQLRTNFKRVECPTKCSKNPTPRIHILDPRCWTRKRRLFLSERALKSPKWDCKFDRLFCPPSVTFLSVHSYAHNSQIADSSSIQNVYFELWAASSTNYYFAILFLRVRGTESKGTTGRTDDSRRNFIAVS